MFRLPIRYSKPIKCCRHTVRRFQINHSLYQSISQATKPAIDPNTDEPNFNNIQNTPLSKNSANQSINQSVNQSISQSTNQSISRPTAQDEQTKSAASMANTILVDVPVKPNQSINQSSNQPSNQASQPNQSTSQSQSTNQSINQSINQSNNLRISKADVDPFLVIKKDPNEVRDSEMIFKSVWQNLVGKYGEENLVFPKDLLFLAGAPGAGKNAMTPLIMDYRGITARPIEVSALLTSPEAQALKSSGQLVSNQSVIELLFDALLKPDYQSGALIDGFPRTREQSECIKLLYDRMMELRTKYQQHPSLSQKFRRPTVHIVVLYIDKDESVRRQLRRGKLAMLHNEIVAATSVGELKPVRETDLSPKLAEERYKQFSQQVFDSLKYIKNQFPFHFIQAEGSPYEVQKRILSELRYQSASELGDETFEIVRKIPLASEIILNARHELIKRLEGYKSWQGPIFERVIHVLHTEFVHILKRQAISGRAIIRSTNQIFSQFPISVDMTLDVLTERGYTAILDMKKEQLPVKFDLQNGQIEMKENRIYEFQISFPKPSIRNEKREENN